MRFNKDGFFEFFLCGVGGRGVVICYVKCAHADAYDQATKSVFKCKASLYHQCVALKQSVKRISKRDLFASSTVVHFFDSATVFAQGPMVKHCA